MLARAARGRGVLDEALPALFHYAQEELGVEIISGLSNAKPTTLCACSSSVLAQRRLSQNVCGPASSVVAWAERLAEGDLVSLGVGNFGFSEETRLGFNRSDCKPAFLQFSDLAVEVVHHQGEQGLTSAVGISNDIYPTIIYYLPHRFVFVWIEIRWSSHQAFVPCTCRGVIGHSNTSEEPFDVHCFLLSQSARAEKRHESCKPASQCLRKRLVIAESRIL
jgi:hypothetical protein